MAETRVYLDNNATTPIHPAVQEAMIKGFELFGNASSMHTFGREARKAVEKARERVAMLIGAEPDEIIFTSGGSESNNTVLNSVGCANEFCSIHSNSHIISTKIEHPSILNTLKCREKAGLKVDYLSNDDKGYINALELERLINNKTRLITVIYGNNEIGTIQDIKKLVNIAHKHGIIFHTDAVQVAGKIRFNVKELDVDFLSLSGHKLYGPKGIGILYAKKGNYVCPLITGGHHEKGRRAGTENTLGIIGLGKAAEIAMEHLNEGVEYIKELKFLLKKGLEERIPDLFFNGDVENGLPGTLNVSFKYVEGESILLYLDLEGIAVSTGSACSTGSLEPSHVLLATGMDVEYAHGSIRFSIGMFNTKEDIEYVLAKLPPIIHRLRKMSPLYKKR